MEVIFFWVLLGHVHVNFPVFDVYLAVGSPSQKMQVGLLTLNAKLLTLWAVHCLSSCHHSVIGSHWFFQTKAFEIHHLVIHLDTSSVMLPEVIGCFGSFNNQRPSPRQLNRGWSTPACVQVALPHPQLTSRDPQSPWCNFCCLGGHVDGPSPTCSCNAQYNVVGPAESLACEPSTRVVNIVSD